MFRAERCTDVPADSLCSVQKHIYFQCCTRFEENRFICQCEKEDKNAEWVSNLALLLVVLKWHHGSEVVKLMTIVCDYEQGDPFYSAAPRGKLN